MVVPSFGTQLRMLQCTARLPEGDDVNVIPGFPSQSFAQRPDRPRILSHKARESDIAPLRSTAVYISCYMFLLSYTLLPACYRALAFHVIDPMFEEGSTRIYRVSLQLSLYSGSSDEHHHRSNLELLSHCIFCAHRTRPVLNRGSHPTIMRQVAHRPNGTRTREHAASLRGTAAGHLAAHYQACNCSANVKDTSILGNNENQLARERMEALPRIPYKTPPRDARQNPAHRPPNKSIGSLSRLGDSEDEWVESHGQ